MTFIYIIHKVIKYMLPQWAILVIFFPVKRKTLLDNPGVDETETLSWVDKPVSYYFVHDCIQHCRL